MIRTVVANFTCDSCSQSFEVYISADIEPGIGISLAQTARHFLEDGAPELGGIAGGFDLCPECFDDHISEGGDRSLDEAGGHDG